MDNQPSVCVLGTQTVQKNVPGHGNATPWYCWVDAQPGNPTARGRI